MLIERAAIGRASKEERLMLYTEKVEELKDLLILDEYQGYMLG